MEEPRALLPHYSTRHCSPQLLRNSLGLHNRKYNPWPVNKALPSLLAGLGTSFSLVPNPFTDVYFEVWIFLSLSEIGEGVCVTWVSVVSLAFSVESKQRESSGNTYVVPSETLKSQQKGPLDPTRLSSVNIFNWNLSTPLCPWVGISFTTDTPCSKSNQGAWIRQCYFVYKSLQTK